jgi:hypothetical protein
METLEKDTVETPVINSWRRKPSLAQTSYATALCRSELPYAERVATIATFPALDSQGISDLITELEAVRAKRYKRLRGLRRGTRAR